VIAGVRGWHLDEVYLKIDASAAWLLKMRVHAKKDGDPGPTIIRVAGSADNDSNDGHFGPRSDREWRRQYASNRPRRGAMTAMRLASRMPKLTPPCPALF
jgi:hypothetical protein